jgi:dUTP pyrophosphatase
MKLYVEKVDKNAKMPERAHATDSGCDVFVCSFDKVFFPGAGNEEVCLDTPEKIKTRAIDQIDSSLDLPTHGRVLVNTGLKVTVDEGYDIQVIPRSGLAINKGLTVCNTPGCIDNDYRGNLSIIIVNTSRKNQKISIGDKIAQLVVRKVEIPEIEEVQKLPAAKTDRGSDGFGSTDKLDRRGREIR